MDQLGSDLRLRWNGEHAAGWSLQLGIDDNDEYDPGATTERDFLHFPFILDVESVADYRELFVSAVADLLASLRRANARYVTSSEAEAWLPGHGRSGPLEA